MKEELVEIRNPKSEGRKKPEARSPKPEPALRPRWQLGFRISALLRPSDFGLRILYSILGAAALLATFLPAPVLAQSAIPDRP